MFTENDRPGSAAAKQIALEPLDVPAGKSAEFFVLYGTGTDMGTGPIGAQHPLGRSGQSDRVPVSVSCDVGASQSGAGKGGGILGARAVAVGSQCKCRTRESKPSSIHPSATSGRPAKSRTACRPFRSGPTCYRGLWIVDGAFLLEAATMLGAGDQARNGVAYELTHQKADGRIEVMAELLEGKRHRALDLRPPRPAHAGQGLAGIASGRSSSGLPHTSRLLRKKTLENNSPLDDGLQPPGFPDGGHRRRAVRIHQHLLESAGLAGLRAGGRSGWARRTRRPPGRRNMTTSWPPSARPPHAT